MLKLKYKSYILCKKLKRENLTISLAESCTGGLLSSILTSYSGASSYFRAALIVYSNQAKSKLLNIDEALIQNKGAVSELVAIELCKNLIKQQKTDLALAITGIAGPKTDLSDKPVGLVYISLSKKNTTIAKKYNFSGNRSKIRKLSCLAAIDLIKENI